MFQSWQWGLVTVACILGTLYSLYLILQAFAWMLSSFSAWHNPKTSEGMPKEPRGFFHKAQDHVLIFDNILEGDFANNEIVPWAIPDMVSRGVRVAIITGPDVLVTSHAVLRAIKDNPEVEFYLIPNKRRAWYQEWDKGKLKAFRQRRFITKDGHCLVIDAPLFFAWLFKRRRPPTFQIFDFDVDFAKYYEAFFRETQEMAIRVNTQNLVAFVKTHGRWTTWVRDLPTATPEEIAELAGHLGEVLEPAEQLILPGVPAIS